MYRRFLFLGLFASVFTVFPFGTNNTSAAEPSFPIKATIQVGDSPQGIAVNPETNRIYVTNYSSNSVSVIDGDTNIVIDTIPVGNAPQGIAVNPVTNKIYVANGNNGDPVSVIDGYNNTVIKSIPVEINARGVTVNPNTNRIYVTTNSNIYFPNLEVIDGASDTVIKGVVPVHSYASSGIGAAVNTLNNRVFVETGNGTVSVFDGNTNEYVDEVVNIGNGTFNGIDINPNSNLVYVAHSVANSSIFVIDGVTNAKLTPIPFLQYQSPQAIRVNPSTNHAFVTTYQGFLWILDLETNQFFDPISLTSALQGIGVNPLTNRVYIAGDGIVTVVEDTLTQPPETGQPIPEEVLVAENQLYLTTKESLRIIDETYISMLEDTARDLTLDGFRIGISKALDLYVDLDKSTPLEDRALYEASKQLAIKTNTDLYKTIGEIVSENTRLPGEELFPDQVDSAHTGFVNQRIVLSPSASIYDAVTDLDEKRGFVAQMPGPILNNRDMVFNTLEYFEQLNSEIKTYMLIGGIGLLTKGIILTGSAPFDLPLSLAMLKASSTLTYINTGNDVGEAIYLLYIFRDVVALDALTTDLYQRELQRVQNGLETGQLPTASGQITNIWVPPVARLNDISTMEASFQNTGPIDIDARLRIYVTDPNGEVRGPYTQDAKSLHPGVIANFSMEIPFTGLLGIFGTTGTHKADISVEYGALGREYLIEYPTILFQVNRQKFDLFKYMTYGSPLTVGLQVTNNGSTPATVAIVDSVPPELGENLSDAVFISQPLKVDETNRTIEWSVDLNPGETKILLYRLPSPLVDLAETSLTPTATLTSSDGSQTASVLLEKDTNMDGLIVGALDLLKSEISELPDSAFNSKEWKARQIKSVLISKVDEVILKVNEKEYPEALDKLTHDIRPKIGGRIDWIISEEEQPKLLMTIDQAAGLIEVLSIP